MSAQDGIAAAQEFIDAFNAQDHERLAASLNYPHIRLTDAFVRIESAAEFAAGSRRGSARLQQEGWHHSDIGAIEAVQVGTDKVHLMMQVSRCHETGEVYTVFDTFWVATRQNGHWGIQFRSSFLEAVRRSR